jgi:uncharacterized membrane protein YphA (DoxX/SURF4 family)
MLFSIDSLIPDVDLYSTSSTTKFGISTCKSFKMRPTDRNGTGENKPEEDVTLQWTKSLGVPAALTYAAIILEFFGGLSLIIGFIVPIVAFFVALEMIGASVLKKTKMKGQYIGGTVAYELDITYLLLAIALMVLGAGAFSVDSVIGV